MAQAHLTLNIAHPNDKGLHQENFQWEFPIQADGNWIQSLMDHLNKENKDDADSRVGKSKPKIVT